MTIAVQNFSGIGARDYRFKLVGGTLKHEKVTFWKMICAAFNWTGEYRLSEIAKAIDKGGIAHTTDIKFYIEFERVIRLYNTWQPQAKRINCLALDMMMKTQLDPEHGLTELSDFEWDEKVLADLRAEQAVLITSLQEKQNAHAELCATDGYKNIYKRVEAYNKLAEVSVRPDVDAFNKLHKSLKDLIDEVDKSGDLKGSYPGYDKESISLFVSDDNWKHFKAGLAAVRKDIQAKKEPIAGREKAIKDERQAISLQLDTIAKKIRAHEGLKVAFERKCEWEKSYDQAMSSKKAQICAEELSAAIDKEKSGAVKISALLGPQLAHMQNCLAARKPDLSAYQALLEDGKLVQDNILAAKVAAGDAFKEPSKAENFQLALKHRIKDDASALRTFFAELIASASGKIESYKISENHVQLKFAEPFDLFKQVPKTILKGDAYWPKIKALVEKYKLAKTADEIYDAMPEFLDLQISVTDCVNLRLEGGRKLVFGADAGMHCQLKLTPEWKKEVSEIAVPAAVGKIKAKSSWIPTGQVPGIIDSILQSMVDQVSMLPIISIEGKTVTEATGDQPVQVPTLSFQFNPTPLIESHVKYFKDTIAKLVSNLLKENDLSISEATLTEACEVICTQVQTTPVTAEN